MPHAKSTDQAERMPGRIEVDPEAAVRGGLVCVHCCAECEDLGLGGIDVSDAEVGVELLGRVPAGQVGARQSSIRWKASVARPSGLSGVTPPPGGTSVAQSRFEPSSTCQSSTRA